MYNDEYLKHMKGGWKSLVNDCVEIQAYPTVLFYELVDKELIVNLEFKIEESDIDSLAQVASLASNDAFDFLSPEEIELQRRLLNDPLYEMKGSHKM